MTDVRVSGKLVVQSQYANPYSGRGDVFATETNIGWESKKLLGGRRDGCQWNGIITLAKTAPGSLSVTYENYVDSGSSLGPPVMAGFAFDARPHEIDQILAIARAHLAPEAWKTDHSSPGTGPCEAIWFREWTDVYTAARDQEARQAAKEAEEEEASDRGDELGVHDCVAYSRSDEQTDYLPPGFTFATARDSVVAVGFTAERDAEALNHPCSIHLCHSDSQDVVDTVALTEILQFESGSDSDGVPPLPLTFVHAFVELRRFAKLEYSSTWDVDLDLRLYVGDEWAGTVNVYADLS